MTREPISLAYVRGEQPPAPPGNVEVEMALLGAMMVDNRQYDAVAEIITAEHFLLPQHGAIYAGMVKLIERGDRVDPRTLWSLVNGDPSLAAVENAPRYLSELAAAAMVVMDAPSYARTIREAWIAREAIGLFERGIMDVRDGMSPIPLTDRLTAIVGDVESLSERNTASSWTYMDTAVRDAVQQSQEAAQRGDGLVGVSTGLKSIDEATGGLEPGTITVIGGRPGMGKSSLADYITDAVATGEVRSGRNWPAACFSLEMLAPQLGQRWLARKAGLDLSDVRRGRIGATDLERLAVLSRSVGKLPLAIDDASGLPLQALRSRARTLYRKHGGLSMILVDHLGLLRKIDNRQARHEFLGEITSGLKGLGKELHCPVVALAQLSRANEQREEKRPQLSDLRESGNIEQDADCVILLHREEYYLMRAPKEFGDKGYEDWLDASHKHRNMCEAIIAKQRQGPACNVMLRFDPKTTAFSDKPSKFDDQEGMNFADERWR